MQKQRVILIIGIGLALITVGLVKFYLDQQRRVAEQLAKTKYEKAKANQTAVIVAKRDIAQGAMLDPADLELKVVSNDQLRPGAITSLDRVSGMITMIPISKDEQITRNMLSQQRLAGDLASATPIGKRAISISVDNLAALGGLIKPGDYVDVIAMINVPVTGVDGKQVNQVTSIPLFQNVLVLAVGQQVSAGSEAGGRYKSETAAKSSPLITLALGPQEASLIAFVQEQGKIRLVLRSPTDAKIEPVQPGSWETLFQYIMPQPAAQSTEPIEPKVIKKQVEIYRGLKKETIPLKE